MSGSQIRPGRRPENGAAAGPAAQRGVALLVVLVVVAIATVVTAAAAYREHLAVARAGNQVFGDQALRYVRGAELWAGRILARERTANATDSAHDLWATGLPPVPVEGGTIAGGITDLQARLNLNDFTARDEATLARAGQRLRRLLGSLEIPEEVAAALADWVDEDGVARPLGGAEDDFYSRLQPPYSAANAPLEHLTEIALLRGVDPPARRRLAAHVTALPGVTPVNVNTAGVPVLTTLGLDVLQAERAVRERADAPFAHLEDFVARLGLDPESFDTGGLSVTSRFFELATRVDVGGREVRHFSLLYRPGAGPVRVLQRSTTGF